MESMYNQIQRLRSIPGIRGNFMCSKAEAARATARAAEWRMWQDQLRTVHIALVQLELTHGDADKRDELSVRERIIEAKVAELKKEYWGSAAAPKENV